MTPFWVMFSFKIYELGVFLVPIKIKKKKHKLSEKIGLPPEEVVFIGSLKMEEVQISVFDMNSVNFVQKKVQDYKEFQFNNPTVSSRWIDVTGLHQTEALKKIGADLKIHSMILADIANTEHSPKIQFHDEIIFIELKILKYNNIDTSLDSEQLSLVLGQNYVASFRETDSGIFDFIKDRITGTGIKVNKYSPGYIHYTLIDAVVDKYYEVLESIGEEIENIEEEVLEKPQPIHIEKIHHLKRNLIFLRKATWPLREIIKKIEITQSKLLDDENDIYIKDLYDHIIQIIDTIETQREILAEMLDIYLSSVSYKLNEIMKVLTVISTIFIPLTFISSIYGMNFRFMPELEMRYGYFVIMGFMFLSGLVMLMLFKKKKWF